MLRRRDGFPIDKIVVSYTGIGGTYLGSNPVPPQPRSSTLLASGRSPGGYCVLAYDDDLWGPRALGAKRNGVAAPLSSVGFSRSSRQYRLPAVLLFTKPTRIATGLRTATARRTATSICTSPTRPRGGTWAAGVTPAKATGYGFDNTVIGTFYVTRGTTGAAFGKFRKVPTDSSLFGYGGGRSANVTITPTGNSTPSSYTWNRANGVWNWDTTSPNSSGEVRHNTRAGMSCSFTDASSSALVDRQYHRHGATGLGQFQQQREELYVHRRCDRRHTSVMKLGSGVVTLAAPNGYAGGTFDKRWGRSTSIPIQHLAAVPNSPSTNLTFGGNGTGGGAR